MMERINYPPEKVYRASKLKKPDYDLIILWMWNNNEIWRIFHHLLCPGIGGDPVNIRRFPQEPRGIWTIPLATCARFQKGSG